MLRNHVNFHEKIKTSLFRSTRFGKDVLSIHRHHLEARWAILASRSSSRSFNEFVKLEAEVEAIPDTPGVEGDGKNHLYRLYPLLAKAIRAAARDREVLESLGKALDEVGKEISGKTLDKDTTEI